MKDTGRYRRVDERGLARPQTLKQRGREMLETRPFGPMRRCAARSCSTAFTVAALCPGCGRRTLRIGRPEEGVES